MCLCYLFSSEEKYEDDRVEGNAGGAQQSQKGAASSEDLKTGF